MIGHTLQVTVQGMEGMARVRCRHDPFVMRLVELLVQCRVMQAPVDPVDAEIGEDEEERELQVVVQVEGFVRRGVVEFTVAAHFGEEERDGEDGHDRQSDQSLSDLEADLVLQVFGVREGGVIEDEEVRERGADEVNNEAEDPEKYCQ